MIKRSYETMYILRSDINEQIVESEIAKYQTYLQDKEAESLVVQHRGRRRLAYEIEGNREGIYVQMNYNVAPSAIKQMEKDMKFDDHVIRSMTIKVKPIEEEEEAEEEPRNVDESSDAALARDANDNGVAVLS
ncbi:30S ribosomal protein S6 [Thalassoporum mexicanum PCC 7367]|uniref:30S ribosomal protein S6 n=1 Tax=Thalassoporum mexicanum TaxID=3457544 RepID=UPI00029FB592|nr:30S ribosomal protein S6 [Pseudanabaena sp. PCC 7367]AFY68329.1 30S ribosomal protein S6 [Pseudanabaena sp. PCC 7367]